MSISTSTANAVAEHAGRDKIRVMVVDDSVVIRGLVSRWIGEEENAEVVAKHVNGLKAVEDIAKSDPDVVVLDIEMPEMDGMTALEKMMAIKPSLCVIMASTLTRRNAEISLKALQLGAADYIPKPESNSGVTTSQDFRREVVEKVLALGARALKQRSLKPSPAMRPRADRVPAKSNTPVEQSFEDTKHIGAALRPFSKAVPRILAVGSSTGGPQALIKVFENITGQIGHIPTVITQHMPPTFTAILADHLARVTKRTAKEADDGELLLNGAIYVAPGAKHLTLREAGGQVFAKLDDGPPVNFCKPAVDPLFRSAVDIFGRATLGVVLTGMGHDGRDGAQAIVSAGGSVIAQDEATSVVWGMPGAVAEAGACSAILPLDQIGPKIGQVLGRL